MPSPLIVALDFETASEALALVHRLPHDAVGMLKVGNQLFTTAGPQLVRDIVAEGFPVFLDLKFHDIPNTVAHAVRAAGQLGVRLVNLHASGGMAMMRAGLEAARETPEMRLIAVTVLTSLNQEDLSQTGVATPLRDQILRLAGLAAKAGLAGVVAPAAQAAAVRQRFPRPFLIVTPGIRPSWAVAGDQKQIATPASALASGADFIVVGRPITQAPDPAAAAARILEGVCDIKVKVKPGGPPSNPRTGH